MLLTHTNKILLLYYIVTTTCLQQHEKQTKATKMFDYQNTNRTIDLYKLPSKSENNKIKQRQQRPQNNENKNKRYMSSSTINNNPSYLHSPEETASSILPGRNRDVTSTTPVQDVTTPVMVSTIPSATIQPDRKSECRISEFYCDSHAQVQLSEQYDDEELSNDEPIGEDLGVGPSGFDKSDSEQVPDDKSVGRKRGSVTLGRVLSGGIGGKCIPLDKVCDGQFDCLDKTDEPPYCTPCNRTYFGEVGRTYELEIRRPREDRLPFLCHLNFTAAGDLYGDLIQLTFDTFTVGKFVSFTTAGCPDGHMSIQEVDRPATGGQWCGSAWGYTVYYSEASSLNVTLQLDRLSQQGIGYNFDFKLAYKFLHRSEARLRYGNNTIGTWRGELQSGTYCDRVLTNCDRRLCRIQSPNYPGVYPRNILCRYRIEQRKVPTGKHALLAVRQTNSHKVHIKDQIVKYDRSQRVLRVWDQCNVVQDYLTFFDGATNESPVLVRLCGGDSVPDIVSSGPNMLLEFHTSPYDNPFHPVPLSYLPGFELEVQVIFVDSNSHSYVRDQRKCEFVITTFDSSFGMLENPKHSLPPNTTCTYNFQGRPNEVVWISFIKYHASSTDPATAFTDLVNDCNNTHLKVWDGNLKNNELKKSNVTLLGKFCKDEIPKLCDHTLLSNKSRIVRPCSIQESYVSSGPELSIQHFLKQGSALSPVSFLLRYEFVDVSQVGVPSKYSNCDRVFNSRMAKDGHFQPPRSTFFYGRGGSKNISCIYRFEANPSERIRISFSKLLLGNKQCHNKKDIRTERYRCEYSRKNLGVAEINISEYPWPGIQIPRDCLCHSGEKVKIMTLSSQVIEINFTVTQMNITDDFNDFFFDGEYQFVGKSESFYDETGICQTHWDNRRLRGTSGEIALRSPPSDVTTVTALQDPDRCVHQPWLIEPEDSLNNYIYLKIRGREITSTQFCSTTNRILVYSGWDTRNPRIICPISSNPTPENQEEKINSNGVVEMFSAGWKFSSIAEEIMLKSHSRSFVIEFLQSEPGNYVVTWMEVSKRPLASSVSSAMTTEWKSAELHSVGGSPPTVMVTPNIDCPFRCPELNACISESLWCDNLKHCPSGFDEEESNCSYQFGIPLLYIFIGALALTVFALLICLTACIKYCQHRRREKKKHLARMQQVNNAGLIGTGSSGSGSASTGGSTNHLSAHNHSHHHHHLMNHHLHPGYPASTGGRYQSGSMRHYHQQHHTHHNAGSVGSLHSNTLYLMDAKDSLC